MGSKKLHITRINSFSRSEWFSENEKLFLKIEKVKIIKKQYWTDFQDSDKNFNEFQNNTLKLEI